MVLGLGARRFIRRLRDLRLRAVRRFRDLYKSFRVWERQQPQQQQPKQIVL